VRGIAQIRLPQGRIIEEEFSRSGSLLERAGDRRPASDCWSNSSKTERSFLMAALVSGADVVIPGRGPAPASRSAVARRTLEVLVFEVGGQAYGLPTADVREIVRAVAITSLPNAPDVIEGVVNVRGRVLPVLDVRTRFRLPATPLDPSDHFIVASAGPRGVVLRVDRATHLALLDEGSIQSPETLGPSGTYVAGVAKLDGGLVLIHDLTTFLSAAEAASLDQALSASA
jgi:purine-binding chemotaxis protein CheW